MTPRAGTANPNSNLNPSSNSNSADVEDKPKDRIESSRGSRLALCAREFGPRRCRMRTCHERYIIHPDKKWHHLWRHFILGWAVYSSFFTPVEFGFFRGLPSKLFWLDIAGQIAFLIDIALHFFLAYRDEQTYRMIDKPTSIALRYVKSGFIIDLLGCLPWDLIYKVLYFWQIISLCNPSVFDNFAYKDTGPYPQEEDHVSSRPQTMWDLTSNGNPMVIL